MRRIGVQGGYVSDLAIYAFIKRIYPNMDMNRPSRQLRAIYNSILYRIQKGKEI